MVLQNYLIIFVIYKKMMKNKDFAIFIMVWGRPEKMWTAKTFKKAGYTGKFYYIADDQDKTVDEYKNKYGENLLVFNKEKAKKKYNYDMGDNTGDLRSTMFSANMSFEFAKKLGLKYFMLCCDDYLSIAFRFDKDLKWKHTSVKNLDKILDIMIDYYKKIPALTIAIAQNGDLIGGKYCQFAKKFKPKRKAMNTFLCSTERPFKFLGRINEDVTTYVNLGSKGKLFLTIPNVSIDQTEHQSQSAGLTDMYLDYGTYVKSFMSVMYNPSCVKVAMMGSSHKRIHHKVLWKYAVPKILNEKYAKI